MNALALALLALEARARTDVVEQIEKATAAYAGYLAAVITDGGETDGTTLLSRADLHQALTMLLDAAHRNVAETLTVAYTAATEVARAATIKQFAALGHDVPTDLGDLGSTLSALLLDVDRAFGNVQTDIQNGVRTAFDGVTGDDPTPARVLATHAALRRATAGLRLRLAASTSTAVHQGARDAQTAVFSNYAAMHTYAQVKKQWVVTSNNPCGMCEALDGTEVGLNDEFDRTATTEGTKLRPVYLDLQGPPRHPNCRCQIELVVQ